MSIEGLIGRSNEVQSVLQLKKKGASSLICVTGRRRVGKSYLFQKIGSQFNNYFEVQALGPDKKPTKQDQLDHFANELSLKFKKRKEYFTDWTEAFHSLAQHTQKIEILILLDEISWMAKDDPLLPAKLKAIWDKELKKNPKMILVICGSVSAWIEDNITKNIDFEGRISLDINLQQFSLKEIHQFLEYKKIKIGLLEEMLLLSVTGGVPKYLEEVLPDQTIEQNLLRLCFKSEGFLYKEYNRIFKDIFQRKTKSMDRIVRLCLDKKQTLPEIAKKLEMDQSGELTQWIHILELSGFVSRDYYFKPDGIPSKLSHLRIKDNYLRFYLKFIEPNKLLMEKGGKFINQISQLGNLETFFGMQFENLILANREMLYSLIGIPLNQIKSAAPFWQKKSKIHKMGCQIDLLINSDTDVFYVCEIKCKKTITKKVITEVQKKMNALSLPKRSSIKPILIYLGDIDADDEIDIQNFFYRIISFKDLL
jgi:AAA+ ATPase superfamily predicted ATPase